GRPARPPNPLATIEQALPARRRRIDAIVSTARVAGTRIPRPDPRESGISPSLCHAGPTHAGAALWAPTFLVAGHTALHRADIGRGRRGLGGAWPRPLDGRG